ncbi:uncharacterized protein N0V89_000860 [Didymosphaeria variabile]|uniref:Uncharacterized protein n=1 Tax=Didymosphaeria variabile TaxID=1932322 RepID=A0A9W8XY84_9PLEO|nr:uncharacterized protein N0V89_000860 [Didymosphaeria variabile]KAJ4360299.1 hypothetical protein N0V89_000860 [Didymosphaeria variabile]
MPIVIRLESWQDPLWMLFASKIRYLLFFIALWNPNATDYTTIGWPQIDRVASHAEHGAAFAIITRFRTNIMVLGVDAAREPFPNWQAWIKNEDVYNVFNAFQRGELKARLEGHAQAVDSVARKWMDEHEITLRGLRGDAEKIAMHVLMSAAFRMEYDFDTGVEIVDPGHEISFGEAMHTCINSSSIMLAPVPFAYETQRFFSAIPMHPKYTGDRNQILKLNSVDTNVPPKKFVSINYNAIHFSPQSGAPMSTNLVQADGSSASLAKSISQRLMGRSLWAGRLDREHVPVRGSVR